MHPLFRYDVFISLFFANQFFLAAGLGRPDLKTRLDIFNNYNESTEKMTCGD